MDISGSELFYLYLSVYILHIIFTLEFENTDFSIQKFKVIDLHGKIQL